MKVNVFSFELLLPTGIKYTGDVSRITFAGSDGILTIMSNHKPLVTNVIPGILEITDVDGGETRFILFDGVAHITPNNCVILSETATLLEEFDPKELEFRIEKARRELQEIGGTDEHRSSLEDFLHQLTTVHGFFENGQYLSK